jgi:hypothetical protein
MKMKCNLLVKVNQSFKMPMLTFVPILQRGDFTQTTSKDSAVDHMTTVWLAKPCNGKKCYRQVRTFFLQIYEFFSGRQPRQNVKVFRHFGDGVILRNEGKPSHFDATVCPRK